MYIGYLDILREGYKVCCQQLQHDEGPYPMSHELFIYGFSRGACMSELSNDITHLFPFLPLSMKEAPYGILKYKTTNQLPGTLEN